MKKYLGIIMLLSITTIIIFITSCKKKEDVVHPYTIGQSYGGGIIFYIDASWQHGLICASEDQVDGIAWQLEPWFQTNVNNTAIGTGQSNTTSLVAINGQGFYAAKLCDDLVLNGYSDWFLPSRDELTTMCTNLYPLGLRNFHFKTYLMESYRYWSSSEMVGGDVWDQSFYISGMGQGYHSKLNNEAVRAVRVF